MTPALLLWKKRARIKLTMHDQPLDKISDPLLMQIAELDHWMCALIHEDVEGQVQGAELRGESPHGSHGAEVQLQHVHLRAAADLGLDGLLAPDPRGDVADGHDDAHAAQRQDARRLPPDAARRTCGAASAEKESSPVSVQRLTWLQPLPRFWCLLLTAE
jgi:hypothetical protein